MTRRGENIYKRKDGRWEGRYIKSRDSYNKALYGYVYGKTYAEVKQKRMIIYNKNTSIKSNILYEDWLTKWIGMQKSHIKESTYVTYYLHIEKHIKPVLGKYKLEQISNYLIQDFIDMKLLNGRLDHKGGLSSKTVKELVNVIILSIKVAIKNQLMLSIDLEFKIKNIRKEFHMLNNKEAQKLINYLKQNNNHYFIGILIMMATGLRIGELCALKNEDINFENKTFLINKTLQRIIDIDHQKTKVIIQSGKSKSSNREIPIPESLMSLLKTNGQLNHYFLTQSERYVEPRSLRYTFKRIIKKLQLPEVTVHSLRHLFATQCIELGFDYNCLSEILGHASPSITMNLYVHSKKDYKKMCMNKVKI